MDEPAKKIEYDENDIDWNALAAKLPCKKKDEKEKKQRKTMFDEFDQNGNGFLSFNEVYTNIKKVLSCENLFDAKPAVMRAF